MLMDPNAPRTQERAYLQPYDIAHRQRSDALLARAQQARAQGVHGAGGLDGAALGRQIAAEGRLGTGTQFSLMQQEAGERQRLAREAALREQMRLRQIQLGAQTAANIGSTVGAGIIGNIPPRNQATRPQGLLLPPEPDVGTTIPGLGGSFYLNDVNRSF